MADFVAAVPLFLVLGAATAGRDVQANAIGGERGRGSNQSAESARRDAIGWSGVWSEG